MMEQLGERHIELNFEVMGRVNLVFLSCSVLLCYKLRYSVLSILDPKD